MINTTHKAISILIPDGESWLAYSVQSCLARIPGIKVSVLSSNPYDPMRFSRYTDRFFSYVSDGSDKAKLAAVHDAVKQAKVDVVLPVDVSMIRLLSAHKTSLLPITALAMLPDIRAMDIAANKWQLAKWLQAQKIPCPATLLYQSNQLFEQALNELTFPVLLKPTQQIGTDLGVGGRGIQIFDQPAALLTFCQENVSTEYIVQSFIEGYDMGCSVLCRAGKIEAYTVQKGFIAGHNRFEPAIGIDFINNTKAYDVVSEVVAKLNWTGVANFDLRYDEQDQQIKVIEINPRFWGSLLGSLCAGVNFPYLSCLAGLGIDLPVADFQASRYVTGDAVAKILCQRFIHKKTIDRDFDRSALEFLMQDPVPKFVAYGVKTYAKMWTCLKY